MHVLLTGFMGSGKTFLMRRLMKVSEASSVFFDLDEEIFKGENEKKSKEGLGTYANLCELISSVGFEHFRMLEEKYLFSLLQSYGQKKMLLSLGGGTLTEKNVLKVLKETGIKLCFLDTELSLCLERIKEDKTRPFSNLSEKELTDLYKSRLQIYQKAELILSTKRQNVLKSLDELIDLKA